ncbi:peptide deformylase [Prevotella sp. OH937_COT-195]|nr:peptide deformylase [Prevotella sp. OH937_COT-195]
MKFLPPSYFKVTWKEGETLDCQIEKYNYKIVILPIYIYGQPVLRKVSEDIPKDFPELPELIQNMFDTLAASEGIGLAAPQIGRDIRVVIIDLDLISDDLPEYKGFRKAFINPHIVEYDDTETETMEEGCLSLPGIHEKVTRPTRIRVRWEDTDRNEHDEWIDGYLARVMQHEFDHLDGKVFTDRISPLRKTMIKNRLKSMLQGKYRCGYRTKPARR